MAWRFLPLFGQIAERHPQLKLIVDHLGLVRSAQGQAAFATLDDLLPLAKLPNVAIKATGAPGYSKKAYPFRDIQDGLHRISMHTGRSGSSGARISRGCHAATASA